MTREEKIIEVTSNYCTKTNSDGYDYIGAAAKEFALETGAEWADENPQSPWISVKDQLPAEILNERVNDVLVARKFSHSTVYRFEVMSYDEAEEMWADKDDYFFPVNDGDMWMPIPKIEEV